MHSHLIVAWFPDWITSGRFVTLAQTCACGRLAGCPLDALPQNIPFTVGRSGCTAPPPVTDYLFLITCFRLSCFLFRNSQLRRLCLLSEEEQKTKQLANIIVRSAVATNICPAFLFSCFDPLLVLRGSSRGTCSSGPAPIARPMGHPPPWAMGSLMIIIIFVFLEQKLKG